MACTAPTPLAQAPPAANCAGVPTTDQLKGFLKAAASTTGPDGDAGGLFHGERMWGAIVNREGKLCTVANSQDDPSQVWPGSLAIAKAKAYTANAFSLDVLALPTARLYTLAQPGHSLWSLEGANLFNAHTLGGPSEMNAGANESTGGNIYFGGGVPLYTGGKIVGALGISGDTSCTDHEIAKRVRDQAGLNPMGGKLADDIQYASADGPGVFTHPLCLNTFRNGTKIGEELPSSGY
jgi:uncharacterized protein GlcG (DUF336 family)